MEIKLILIHFNVQSLRIEIKLECFVKFFAKCMGFEKTIGVILICFCCLNKDVISYPKISLINKGEAKKVQVTE